MWYKVEAKYGDNDDWQEVGGTYYRPDCDAIERHVLYEGATETRIVEVEEK